MTRCHVLSVFLLICSLQNSFIEGNPVHDNFGSDGFYGSHYNSNTGDDKFSDIRKVMFGDDFFSKPKKSIFDDDSFTEPRKSMFDDDSFSNPKKSIFDDASFSNPKKSIFDDDSFPNFGKSMFDDNPFSYQQKSPFDSVPMKNGFDDPFSNPGLPNNRFRKTTVITLSSPNSHVPLNPNRNFPLQPIRVRISPLKSGYTNPIVGDKDSSSQSSKSSDSSDSSDEDKNMRKKKKKLGIVAIVATHPGSSSISPSSPCSTCGNPVPMPSLPYEHPIGTPCPHFNHAPVTPPTPMPAPYVPPAAPVSAPYVPPVATPPYPSHDHWPLAGAALGGAAAGALAASALNRPAKPQPPLAAHPYPNQAENQHEKKCNYCIRPSCRPTVRPSPNFNPAVDSAQLKKAMEGFGTKEETLVKILTRRSEDQIQKIVNEYTKNGRALRADIEGDTSFKFRKLLVALVTPLPVYYAEQLHNALVKEDEMTMIEILTSLSDCAIREVNVAYNLLHDTTLPTKIKLKTNLDFQKFMLALNEGKRDPNQQVNEAAAKKDAKRLVDAGVAKWFGTDEDTFIDIFAHRSFPQLRAIIKEYDLMRNASGGNIRTDIKKEFSGKLCTGLKRLVKNIKDQPSFFADELDDALDGTWTPDDNEKLIRIMRGRSGIDLGDIKDNFDRRYKKSLATRITGLTYLEYKTALLSLLGVQL